MGHTATSEDDAKTIVDSLTKLAKYKKERGGESRKFYSKWNSAHKYPRVQECEVRDPKAFEEYRQRCRIYFDHRDAAVAEFEREVECSMPEICKKVLSLMETTPYICWDSASFEYSNIKIVRK
ncbi:hypothetical protein LCGC14_0478810 [marine sediment metagenome]|uniref:Uncharacterized protein n=1 Tax=marine sediment metagenome TaxID=412755 RepID=A0A0F9ST17_9ZZZZ